MKINPINRLNDVYKVANNKQNINKVTKKEVDTFSISEAGKDISVARKALQNTEEIRTEKVDVIKDKINTGTYNVSGEQIAEKIVNKYIDFYS